MSRLLLADAEPGVSDLLALSLQHEGHQVTLARDAAEVPRLIQHELPDMALIGCTQDDLRGLQLARRLRSEARTQHLSIILMPEQGCAVPLTTALDAGADDCLPKPFSLQELFARMQAVLQRKSPHSLGLPVEVAGLRLDPTTRRVSHAGHDIRLGPTEFRLLHFLLAHPERVHSRERVLSQVWGEHDDISLRTVDVHIKRLRQCLVPAGCAHLVETIRGSGYRLSALAVASQVAGVCAADS
ncbi:MAG: phosphate regulon transcriptional regulator PhoB [Pseudomonadota bacterium]|jgi:two-component system phosphate regulon response regulator PhoB